MAQESEGSIWISLLCVAGLVGLYAHTNPLPWQEEHIAENAVKERLRDPDSARFQDIVIVKKKDKSRVVCGQVNAKNATGGMGGFRLFFVTENVDRHKIFATYATDSPTFTEKTGDEAITTDTALIENALMFTADYLAACEQP